LEEERLDFTKSSLWTYANIASTVCVSDDAVCRPSPLPTYGANNLLKSCEKIRVSLEDCEVEKDIVHFIKERGTGQEIPDAPRFINFCKEDNDTGSEIDESEGYSVAQFQRTMNPAFRTSSPQPSTFESHHDPQSDLAAQMGHPPPPANIVQPPQQVQPQPVQHQPVQHQEVEPQPVQPQQPAPLDLRRGGYLPPNYDPEQHGEINKIPHNAYPTDGMTMFCRTGPPSERSSATSAYRPSSRESQSEVSNPTSMSSVEASIPVSAKQASPQKPTNSAPLPSSGEDRSVQKKKSAFFSNSPFRRKSRHEKDRPVITSQSASQPASRSPWNSPTKHSSPSKASPGYSSPFKASPGHYSPSKATPNQSSPSKAAPSQLERRAASPDPVDPRANFQLNVGNNVFDVASPDKNGTKAGSQQSNGAEDDLDPIARALADLKTGGKQSTLRVSADRYHGISTPTPSAPSSAYDGSTSGAPPAYNDPSAKRLDAPEPAFTSKQMQKTTQRYTGQTQSMLRGGSNKPAMAPKAQEVPRARSPAARRSVSPQVSPRVDTRMGAQYSGGSVPSPTAPQSSSMRSRYSQSPTPHRAQDPPYSPNDFVRRASPATSHRAVSPQPQFRQQARPSSAGGMELQLSGGQVEMYGGSGGSQGYGSRRGGRPSSYYGDGGGAPPVGRSRSRTVAVADPARKFSRDGRPILHFGKHPSPCFFVPSPNTNFTSQLAQCTATLLPFPRSSASARAMSSQ